MWRAVFAPLFDFWYECTPHMYHLYQGKIVKNVILQSSEIGILSKACIIITYLSALEMTLKIMQKWRFFNKKRKKLRSYLPCEIFFDIKYLQYYLSEIKSKKRTFHLLTGIYKWFFQKSNFSLRKWNVIF